MTEAEAKRAAFAVRTGAVRAAALPLARFLACLPAATSLSRSPALATRLLPGLCGRRRV